MGLNPFLDCLNQDRKKGKDATFEAKPQRRPYTIFNFPSSQKLPFPACFLLTLRKGENRRWIGDYVKKENK